MEIIELGELNQDQRAELEGDEFDPFESRRNDIRCWRPKERHVALQRDDGRLLASAGLVVAAIEVGDRPASDVVGIGGVIVAQPFRGRGLADRLLEATIERAGAMGPGLALLFCYPESAGLYERHGFAEISPPLMVEQPEGFVRMPMVSMARPLHDWGALPPGQVKLRGFPF